MARALDALTKNVKLLAWLRDVVELCKPDDVYACDGSPEEYRYLCDILVQKGTFTALSEERRPFSFLARSDPSDAAMFEDRTFIATSWMEEAGPMNNWVPYREMKQKMLRVFQDCMQRRTMYIVPFALGPLGSPFGRIGVQVTDSPYVAASLSLLATVGMPVLEALGPDGEFIPCLHSVGFPLAPFQGDVPWPCARYQRHKYIVHFTAEPSVWSYGSGYGENAVLSKKCVALRLASCVARKEGWLAEHMALFGLTSPQGKTYYMAAAFPDGVGKSTLAMLRPSLPGWQITCLGDDVAWLRLGEDGRLWAVNPEKGFLGPLRGTSEASNPHMMQALGRNAIFTNAGLTGDGDVWWEDNGGLATPPVTDWQGQGWTADSGGNVAHPAACFAVPAAQCPVLDERWQEPAGVPVSALLLGARRRDVVPLVTQAFDWEHAVFLGSLLATEVQEADSRRSVKLRRDPFGMGSFCGYNLADYLAHWLSFKERTVEGRLPKVFMVNWFRTAPDGRLVWPGFGENSRILSWIVDRLEGRGDAVETALGYLPAPGALDLGDLAMSAADLRTLLELDREAWRKEAEEIAKFYDEFGERLPGELREQLSALKERLC